MRGAFTKVLFHWPSTIKHDHFDLEKELRYNVGKIRLRKLQQNCEFFAYSSDEQGQTVAFLSKVDEFDAHIAMPKNTKWEYLAGMVPHGGDNVFLFSYIWFSSLMNAKEYVLRHGMKIQGGWNESES
jgi:threonine dehydratase